MMKGKELSLIYTGGFGYASYISELSPLRQEPCLYIHLQVSRSLWTDEGGVRRQASSIEKIAAVRP